MIVSDDMGRHVTYVLFVYLNAVIVVAAYSQDESTAFLPKPTTANTQSILTSYGATNISSNNTTSTTTEESTEENVVYDDLYYTRLIPALSTIGIFLIGLLVIYISYCMKQRKDYTKKVIESDNLDSDWLQHLKKTQKKGFLRRKSPFQTKLLSQDRKTILKKYALYDEMLASYKQSLKMQKLNSIRKANVTSSSNQSQVTNEGTPLRRVNSKMRMKELAMSHKHFHEY